MQRIATVIRDLGNNIKEVEVSRKTACEGCEMHGECHACIMLGDEKQNRELRTKAKDPLGAKVGDKVEIETDSKTVIKYAAQVFLLPIFLGAVGYLLGEWLGNFVTEKIAELLPLFCSLFGFAAAFVYIKFVPAKKSEKNCDVTIVNIFPHSDKPPIANSHI